MRVQWAIPVLASILILATFSVPSASALSGFSGDYDPVNWTLTNTNADGSVDTSGAPTSIVLVGGDNFSFRPGDTDFTLTVPCGGTISFDWRYQTFNGPFWDRAGYLVNGAFTQLSDNSGPQVQEGMTSVTVSTGDTFGYRIHTLDNIVGVASFAPITNLQTPDCNTPPVVTASLEPICGEDDEGLFRVVFSAEDAENNITSLLVELNGIPVENGQVVELELDEESESEFDDGILEIEAPSFTLTVTATDSEGASDTATSSAEFSDLVECDDDDE